MRRAMTLGVLVVVGGLLVVKAQPAADAPKVVEVEKVKDNLFVLRGGGGNTAVFVMANGVAVVDAKNPGWRHPTTRSRSSLQSGDAADQHAYARRPCERQRGVSGDGG